MTDQSPTREELIEKAEAFTQHAERAYHERGSLVFCSGKTLRPAVLRGLLDALRSDSQRIAELEGEVGSLKEALSEIAEHPGPNADDAAHLRADIAREALTAIQTQGAK